MSKKIALVTGCSDGGLGAALALALHKKGYRVIATGRNLSKLGSMKSNNIETVELDVLSQSSIAKAVSEVSALTGGKLNMLVNNAGGPCSMPIADLDIDKLRAVFELNVFSVISVTQAFLPLLRASNDGWVVNNTSIAGTLHGGVPFQSAYNATKAAIGIMTNNLRLELKPFNIRVVDLKTAAVRSQFFQSTRVQLPEKSIYQPAKTEIEKFMNGGDLMDDAPTAEQWATQVVNSLTARSPPNQISKGKAASLLYWASYFPVSWFDSEVMKIVGLKTLAERLKH